MFRNFARTNPRRLPGRDVLELEDAEQVVVDLDEHALAHAGGLNGAHALVQ